MKNRVALLFVFTIILSLTACRSSDSDTTQSLRPQPTVSEKQYMTDVETQAYEWKCDIPPAEIKTYDGSPLEGFFIAEDEKLYEYNAQQIFPQTEKNYRIVETEFKIREIDYHFQLDKLTVLTDDFKTYSYDKNENTFTAIENDFGGVIKEFSERGRVISWTNSSFNTSNIWWIDEKNDVYEIKQTEGIAYTQSLLCSVPKEEKITAAASGVLKTQSGYYCFDMQQRCFILKEEPTAASDNIAFLNDMILLYQDDPTHIYDHKLVYTVRFSYY